MVAEGLTEIDNLAASWWEMSWPHLMPPDERYWFRRFGRYGVHARINELRVSSPLGLTLQCTPEWIAIYLAIVFGGWTIINGTWNMIATYDDLKRNLEIIRSDIRTSIEGLKGLSNRARQIASDVIDMLIDGLLRLAETELEMALEHIRRIQEARLRLAQPSEPVHSVIEVIEDSTERPRQG
jgi:hypothetical protein